MKSFKFIWILCILIPYACKKEGQKDNHFVSLQNITYNTFQDPSLINIQLNFNIQGGYHIQPDKPSEADFIATDFTIQYPINIKIKDVTFNYSPKLWSLDEHTFFKVISNEFSVTISIENAQNFDTIKKLEGVLYYQACDDKKCFFPRKLPISVNLN